MGAIADMVNTLAALTVTGVHRRYTYPPESLNGSDLPASFVMPPASDYEALTTCTTDDDTVTARLVVAIESYPQDSQRVNYERLLTIADNLNAALKTGRGSLGGLVTWSIAPQTSEPIIVAGIAYWGVTATVTARYF